MMTVMKTMATVKSRRRIILDDQLPTHAPPRVQVIFVYDVGESDDSSEDIYTLADGKPLTIEGQDHN